MKNLIFMIVLGAGLMSCSVIEGAMGGSEGEATSFGGIIDTLWGMLSAFVPSLAAWEGEVASAAVEAVSVKKKA